MGLGDIAKYVFFPEAHAHKMELKRQKKLAKLNKNKYKYGATPGYKYGAPGAVPYGAHQGVAPGASSSAYPGAYGQPTAYGGLTPYDQHKQQKKLAKKYGKHGHYPGQVFASGPGPYGQQPGQQQPVQVQQKPVQVVQQVSVQQQIPQSQTIVTTSPQLTQQQLVPVQQVTTTTQPQTHQTVQVHQPQPQVQVQQQPGTVAFFQPAPVPQQQQTVVAYQYPPSTTIPLASAPLRHSTGNQELQTIYQYGANGQVTPINFVAVGPNGGVKKVSQNGVKK